MPVNQPELETDDQYEFDFDPNMLDATDEANEEIETPEGEEAESGENNAGGDQAGQAREEGRVLTRGERRFQKLANERRDAIKAKEQADLQLAEERKQRAFEQQQYAQHQRQLQDVARMREQYEQMSPEERMQFAFQQQNNYMQQQMQIQQLQFADMNDKSEFSVLCAQDKRAAKYAGEVEATLTRMRQGGSNATRRDIYFYLLGQKVHTAVNGQAGRTAKNAAAANVRRQTTAPGRTRGSDTPGSRTKMSDMEALEERLKNVPL